MIFFWTKSDKIGSRLIRWGLGEDCSHFAIGFFEDSGDPRVLESRAETGVKDSKLSDFLADGKEIVHAEQFFDLGDNEKVIYDAMRSELEGARYDKIAVCYWLCVGLRLRLFGAKIPLRNAWGRDELVYCVEIAQVIPGILYEIGIDVSTFDLEMTSPHGFYDMVKETGALRSIEGAF